MKRVVNTFSLGITIIFLTFVMMMSGCNSESALPLPEQTLTTTALPTVSPIALPTVSATEKPTATPSLIPSQQTPTVSPTFTTTLTPTIPAEAHLDVQCIDVVDKPLETGVYSGTVVLGGYLNVPSQLLDLSTGINAPLVRNGGGTSVYESVSPDHEWLAYKIPHQNTLVITSVKEDAKSTNLAWEDDWILSYGWLDNQNLLFLREDRTMLLLNSFTETRKVLYLNFPDPADPLYANYWGPAVFNSLLTRTVYPTVDRRIVLWDVLNWREIAYLESENNPYGGIPVWTPAGDGFVMSLQKYDDKKKTLTEELYWVTQEGKITQLTNLSAYYSKILNIAQYSWSPDLNKIAFWIRYGWEKEFNQEQLSILDVTTLQTTNLCLPGAFVNEVPVWSPDGRQLLVISYWGNDLAVLLIDLDKRIAFKIADRYRLVGWLK